MAIDKVLGLRSPLLAFPLLMGLKHGAARS